MMIDIITMGCSKNLVDSQQLRRLFRSCGFSVCMEPEVVHGDVAVVNTCGFIGDAKEESINMILELCQRKSEGKLRAVYVMGCLSQRYKDELETEIPQVDRYYGKFDWTGMAEDLSARFPVNVQPDNVPVEIDNTPTHYAYIKIAEGCDRKCAYCAIPIITGHHESRPMEEILDEVRELANQGIREFQIIEQELTYYGLDFYGKQMIAPLIEQMAQIPGVEWIRLHYAYPNNFPLDLLRVIRENDNVCKYLDIALQHVSDKVLGRMRRHVTKAETLHLLETIRREVPGICLRTTLMVGFPGETEADFDELLEFVRSARFERMGAFAYCEEEGTYAALHYQDDVPSDVKQLRLDKLMRVQEKISADINSEKVGKTFKVMIDRKEGEFYVGRTQYDSPEVDGEVLVRATAELAVGHFYPVKIDQADEFDLYGTIEHNYIHSII